MASEPREPVKEPSSVRTARGTVPVGSAGSPTPRWLWALVLGGFGLIFWGFTPEALTFVPYSPWFLEQVERGNVESLSIRGTEIRGRLRTAAPHRDGSSARGSAISKFVTHAPSAESVEPLVRSLREENRGKGPVAIEIKPARLYSMKSWVALALSPIVLLLVIALVRTIAASLGR